MNLERLTSQPVSQKLPAVKLPKYFTTNGAWRFASANGNFLRHTLQPNYSFMTLFSFIESSGLLFNSKQID